VTSAPDDTLTRWTDLLLPRFRWGEILPRTSGVRRGEGYQFYRLVPLDMMLVSIGLGIEDYTPEGVENAMPNFWPCVEALTEEHVDRILLAGVPISSQLGRARVLALQDQVRQRTGIEMDASLEAILAGLHRLGARRVVVASRWAEPLNRALCAYLDAGGVEVLATTARGQWAASAFGMSLEEGLRTALEVGREAARLAPAAEAIVVPGGAAMSLHVVPALEEEADKPVLTNLNAEVWNGLVRPGVIPPVQGWGRLLAAL
jgi:maleate cis-trans isomerase